MKLIRRERTELEQALLDVEIAKRHLDYATTDEHFRVLCECITVAEKKANQLYIRQKDNERYNEYMSKLDGQISKLKESVEDAESDDICSADSTRLASLFNRYFSWTGYEIRK